MTKPSQPDTDSSTDSKRELSQHTPVCVPCERNYRCELNGILVRLGPDAITAADLYKCPGCGHQIVKGFAREPGERYGLNQAVFGACDPLMGDATITDHTGRPIAQAVVEWEHRELDKRPQQAAEMLAER